METFPQISWLSLRRTINQSTRKISTQSIRGKILIRRPRLLGFLQMVAPKFFEVVKAEKKLQHRCAGNHAREGRGREIFEFNLCNLFVFFCGNLCVYHWKNVCCGCILLITQSTLSQKNVATPTKAIRRLGGTREKLIACLNKSRRTQFPCYYFFKKYLCRQPEAVPGLDGGG